MAALLIVIIYITFVSLGLPDSLLGAAWPVIRSEMDVPLSYAGLITMIVSGNTIFASLMSDRLTRKTGAGLASVLGLLVVGAAIFGFSVSHSFWILCLFAIPYGLGAGTLDAALNNYVSLHYSARHMNWLHGCWGLGASISPYIMGHYLTNGLNWQGGYGTVGLIQAAMAVGLMFSLPLWKKRDPSGPQSGGRALSLRQIFRIKGVKLVLPAFLCYCALEMTCIVWAVTYLVEMRGIDPAVAARYASLFLLGITAGRFLSGAVTGKVGDWAMIRIGGGLILLGITGVILPSESPWVCLYGLIIIGLGCAPIYPAIIHLTPANFGADKSGAIIGVQMASAYTGSTLMPPLFGLLAGGIGLWLFPFFILIFAVMALVLLGLLRRIVKG
jgi:fucose permease